MKKNLLLLFILLIAQIGVYAYKYLPNLSSYDKQEYHAGRQNWDVDIDKYGVVYFANTDGLLCNVYGEWDLVTMTNKGVVRAVLADNDTIWCGGAEYGYFFKDKAKLTFHSIDSMEGDQIWNIEKQGNSIFFQSENHLIKYNKTTKSYDQITYPEGIWSMMKWREKIWLILRDGQLGYLNHDKFEHVTHIEPIVNREVRKTFVHNDMLYLVMFEGGLYRYDGNQVEQISTPDQLKENALFTGIPYDNDSYCLGTVSDGFLQIDNHGAIKKWVNASHGLMDNTILSMKSDPQGNIWLGLDYGIAKIELQSPINAVFDGGATYFIKNFKGHTYLATNKGLFRSNSQGTFDFVENSGGQIWSISEINNELYISHNRGLFKLKKNKKEVTPIVKYSGFLDVAHFENTDYYLFSTYNGLVLNKRQGNEFQYIKNLSLWGVTKLVYDKTNRCVWAEIKDAHILKLSLNTDFSVKTEKLTNIKKVFETNHGIYFSNDEQLLQYKNSVFYTTNQPLLNAIKSKQLKALDYSSDGNSLAYIQGNEVKLNVLLPDGNTHSYNTLLKSLGKNINTGYEFVDLKDNLLRLATDRGVTVFDMNHRSSFKKSSLPVISSIEVLNKNQEHYYYPFPAEGIKFPSGNKDLKFRFSINKSEYDVVEYRYRLTSHDIEWTEWTTLENDIFYPQIKGGKYIFHLQSRINGGQTHESSLAFTIDKLWYQTSWVVIPILLIVLLWMLGSIFVMSRISELKLKKQKQLFTQREAKKTLTMKNEQLLQYTEIISHKNEFLNKVKEGLDSMRSAEAQRWVKMISNEVNNEKKEFLFHKLFSEIHQDFISRLTETHPTLTPNDVRILSFIRINLDKKEISNLMNISTRSLDTNRYRLKKKLNLNPDQDLNHFIREF